MPWRWWDDCHDPRVIRAKASQSPSQGAWWVHRLSSHISKMVLSIVHAILKGTVPRGAASCSLRGFGMHAGPRY